MFPQKRPITAVIDSETYPLGEKSEHSDFECALALVALSHTPVEQRLYSAMLSASSENSNDNEFTARRLVELTEIRSLSTIRRGLEGLLVKLSIARSVKRNANGRREQAMAYRVFSPAEVMTRRNENGVMGQLDRVSSVNNGNHSFDRAIARVAENLMLSRREAQVALCCVEGLTNAEIGKRLDVSEQTVKFHLRHIFIKFGVRRRAELISRLLT